MAMVEATSSELHQQHKSLEVRLRLLEAEAVDLEARRGQAVLAGGEPLAQLHQRVAEVEVEQADVAAALAALEAPLARAREHEGQERQQALRQAARSLCEQRLQAASAVDRALQLLAREVGRWQGLARHLAPVTYELGLGDGLRIATSTPADAEALRAALWMHAPDTAALLGLKPVEGRPLTTTDGANAVHQRLAWAA
jgi:hypothetical protein